MLPEKFTIRDDFPPVDYADWRVVAEADLHGASFEQKLVTHTYEGIDIQPLYCRDPSALPDAQGFPGWAPFVRGATPLGNVVDGVDLQQEHSHPDSQGANQAILDDLQGGASSVLLRLDQAACLGWDPDQPQAGELPDRDGLTVYTVDDLDQVLADVDLALMGVGLEAGAAFTPAAALLIALWQRRQAPTETLRGAFNADPLGVLAGSGRLPMRPEMALELLGELAHWTVQHLPRVTAVGVDTSPYHHAGATASQDLAFAVATGLSYLRCLVAAGLSVEAAARQIVFHMRVGTHHFLSIAKLRAARRLWWQVVETCGGSPAAAAMRQHVRTSQRVLTHRDPYVNLLRNTVSSFAAIIGGAESFTSLPFDTMNGLPDAFSRRVARNTVLILQEEAHLHRVVDAAGGSWFLDELTNKVSALAWEVVQAIERQGGMLSALRSGWVADQIDSAFAPRAKDIARRKEGITGVSEFPDIGEEPVTPPQPDRAALLTTTAARIAAQRPVGGPSLATASRMADLIEAASRGHTIGQLAAALGFHGESCEGAPLELRSFAEPFEELRDASDAWRAAHGARPRVFLANLGPVSHHTARATYSKNFFEAGGFEVIGNDGFRDAQTACQAFQSSGARIAVICSSDKLYPDFVPAVAAGLKEAGARTVVLAGNPGPNEQAWRDAGVDRFIFVKCDVLATLREMLREEGVLAS